MELGIGIHLEIARVKWSRARAKGKERLKKSVGDKIKSFIFGAAWSHERMTRQRW